MRELCDQLRELATDSNKYRAKKERRAQRSSFRDVLHTVADWQYPDEQVRFGTETLDIDSWTRKRQYDALCNVVGTGMNTHLQVGVTVKSHIPVREVMNVGAGTLTSQLATQCFAGCCC